MSGGGTLYLFVGDHGSSDETKGHDTTIDLWGIAPDPASERKWKSVRHEKFTSADLRELFPQGLDRGRVVFCMTQCYSGGFHFIGLPRHVPSNPAWFTGEVPAWVRPAAEDSLPLAAGCDPNPDNWAGYERFVPEHLLGFDLFSLAPAGRRRDSFFDAHIEATLVDKTIDKPHSTSKRYLERWVTAIEKLAAEKNLTHKV